MKIAKKLFQTVCLAALFLSAGFLLYHMVYLPMENKKLVAELKGNFPEPEAPGASGSEKKDQPAGRKCPVAAVDLVSLREQYPDVQGWLTIPDTGIDYPVLQSEQENGEFYLKRNYKKEYDINGSLFLQADCKVSESRNLIIYGHNMNSGAMFGNLDQYSSYEYWKAHPRVFFQTPEEMEEYRIAAVLKADVSMFDFQRTSFQSPQELEAYVQQAKALSLFETGVDGIGCEETLTLVTCSYEWKQARNKSSPNLCVNSSFSYVVLSTLLLSSRDLTEWSLVYHNTLSYQRFYDLHSIHYDHLEGLHQLI